MALVLITNITATLLMVGIVWFVQIVHYPLYTRINPDAFPNYEVAHVNLVTIIVAPLMFIEAITALLLVISPPGDIPLWVMIVGLGLVGVIWGMTVFVNVPQHNALSYSFDEGVHRNLIRANWVRTAAWTARGALVLWLMAQLLAV